MLDITWDAIDERYYEYGLDRGALYIGNEPPIPWNGLTGFEEGSEAGASSILYRDGEIYHTEVAASDFSGSVTSLCYPEEFGECMGIVKVSEGLYVDNQRPKRFSMSYRTLVGSGGVDDLFGHQIHLIYNATPSIGARSRKTVTKDVDRVEFSVELVCKPVKLTGYRPSAHYIIDTRGMHHTRVEYIEDILYGSTNGEGEDQVIRVGRMPDVNELSAIVAWESNVITEPITEDFPL